MDARISEYGCPYQCIWMPVSVNMDTRISVYEYLYQCIWMPASVYMDICISVYGCPYQCIWMPVSVYMDAYTCVRLNSVLSLCLHSAQQKYIFFGIRVCFSLGKSLPTPTSSHILPDFLPFPSQHPPISTPTSTHFLPDTLPFLLPL